MFVAGNVIGFLWLDPQDAVEHGVDAGAGLGVNGVATMVDPVVCPLVRFEGLRFEADDAGEVNDVQEGIQERFLGEDAFGDRACLA